MGADAALLFSFSGLGIRPVMTRLGLSFFLVAGGGLLRVLLPPGSLLETAAEVAWLLLATLSLCALLTSDWLRATLKAFPGTLRSAFRSLRITG